MTDADLDAIELLAEAATPGPWKWEEWPPKLQTCLTATSLPFGQGCVLEPFEMAEPSEADWRFIEQSRTDVPALVAEVRRLLAAQPHMAEGHVATSIGFDADDGAVLVQIGASRLVFTPDKAMSFAKQIMEAATQSVAHMRLPTMD